MCDTTTHITTHRKVGFWVVCRCFPNWCKFHYNNTNDYIGQNNYFCVADLADSTLLQDGAQDGENFNVFLSHRIFARLDDYDFGHHFSYTFNIM